jgi:hypothetical protein
MVKPATTVVVVRRFVVAPAQKGASMLRKRRFFGALLVSLALIVGGLPSVAHANTVAQLNLTLAGDYSCVGPCATAPNFSVDGIAYSGSKSFGTMKIALAGTVLGVDPINPQCLDQSENWALTTQKGKNAILLSTTADTICSTANPNILLENGTFTVTGDTGLFSTATGAGSLMWTVLVHPQNGRGTLSGTITY